VTGAISDPARALEGLWHFVTSLHGALSWLFANPLLRLFKVELAFLQEHTDALEAVRDALSRVAAWIWVYVVRPRFNQLAARIAALRAWTAGQIRTVYLVMGILYQAARAYARQLTAAERTARTAADKAEHADMVKRVAAALAAVQHAAASGYATGLHDRISIAGRIADDLAAHNPAVKDLVKALTAAVIDLETIDNPAARWIITRLVSAIIAKLGVDKAAADLLNALLGPLAGQPRPAGLYDVTRDVSARLNALEDQWAQFMASGGPDVEQAGRQWKTLSSVLVDAGLLGVFGLAVTDPSAFAAGVADSIGTAGNDALAGIVSLINHA
jgi:hypothetical protein